MTTDLDERVVGRIIPIRTPVALALAARDPATALATGMRPGAIGAPGATVGVIGCRVRFAWCGRRGAGGQREAA